MEVYQKPATMQQQVIFYGVFKGRAKFLGLFLTHSHKAMNMQLGSSIVFICIFPKPSTIGKKSFKILLL